MVRLQPLIIRFATCGIALFSLSGINAEEIVIRTPEGDSLVIEVDPQESFADVIAKMEANINTETNDAINEDISRRFVIDFMCSGIQNVRASASAFSDEMRVYNGPISDSQKDDMRYILTSLASKSWTELLKSKSSMNRAGDRIDSIHPLKFLTAIFKNEELKGCLHSIRDRKKIWDNFFEGLEESLNEEARRSNMNDFIQDFANNLGINASAVRDQIINRKWPELVDTLLKLLPRQGNPGRYDM